MVEQNGSGVYTQIVYAPGGQKFALMNGQTLQKAFAPLPGGVAIKIGDEIVGALGVSGSPGGDKDEACAQAGVASIKDDLARPR